MLFLLLVTLISMLLAVIMSVIAWRAAQEEKRRSDARIAALAAEIHDTDRPHAAPRAEADLDLRRPVETPVSLPVTGLFETSGAARTGPRLATVVGIGLLVSAATAHVASPANLENRANQASSANPANHATSENLVPLELLALGHERNGDRLMVRGVVRNPSAGREIDRVIAVVFLYNRDGGFLASGRAAIESTALVPGGESGFIVVVPGASNVGRYRVSFRTEDRVVPHVDRRDRGQEKS
ncbi:MAG: hypothetical protein AUJ01_00205 [Acidobacteria bacterium 13_1_40CM_3_65_5]|nr:MAG: hypothetical protein AUJ01_00205 [Acidobacteria bacterium 13_1_40CM_3_65_5]